MKDLLPFNAEKAGKETFRESSTCVVCQFKLFSLMRVPRTMISYSSSIAVRCCARDDDECVPQNAPRQNQN